MQLSSLLGFVLLLGSKSQSRFGKRSLVVCLVHAGRAGVLRAGGVAPCAYPCSTGIDAHLFRGVNICLQVRLHNLHQVRVLCRTPRCCAACLLRDAAVPALGNQAGFSPSPPNSRCDLLTSQRNEAGVGHYACAQYTRA